MQQLLDSVAVERFVQGQQIVEGAAERLKSVVTHENPASSGRAQFNNSRCTN